MNANQYVNAVARKIKCGGAKKKEIKRQLLADIGVRLEQGEPIEEIIEQMGSMQEIASGFNESISQEERRRYTRNKTLKIVLPIVAAVVLLGVCIYWMLPKSKDVSQSTLFSEAQVEAAMKETVELIDENAYEALQGKAIPQMQAFLSKEEIDKVKAQMSADWGERQKFGTVYMSEVIQGNVHFAVGEITVIYENITVTYRLTYDKEMRLAGLYVR